MLSEETTECYQFPLFHKVDLDDQYLLNTVEGEWFEILYFFPFEDYRVPAAKYYDALYDFNVRQQTTPKQTGEETLETKEAARQRLLFDRTTMQTSEAASEILYQA